MSICRLTLLALTAVVALTTLAACGISRSETSPTSTPPATAASPSSPVVSPASPSPSASASPDTTTEPGTIISVYFLRGQFVGAAHRTVAVTNAPATAALRELLMGPTAEEAAAGLHTQIPAATRLLGLRIHDGLAVVDLSGDFAAGVDPVEDRGRLAQIVYTLTQFPTVDGVKFRIDGEPLVFRSPEGAPLTRAQTRRSFEDVTPAVFVERPAVGDTVSSPLVVSGTANTFEAQFMIRIRAADGAVLREESAMATSGSGTRGTFNETVTFSTESAGIVLEVYESSAASGLPIHLVKIPLPLSRAAAP